MELAEREGLDAVIEKLIPRMFAPPSQQQPTVLNEFRAMARRSSLDDFKGQVRAALNRGDHRAMLARVKIPALLVCGALDVWSPVAQHRDSLALLQHGRLDIIEDTGHMTPMESPRQLNEILFRWLTDFSYTEKPG